MKLQIFGHSGEKGGKAFQLLNRVFSTQLMRFLIVGGTATLIDYILYMIISLRAPISIAKSISMFAASLFSYFVNKRWTFGVQSKKNGKYLLKYYLAQIGNFSANIGANYLALTYTHNKTASFIIATFCGMSVNFLLQKFLVFREQH